MTEKVLQRVSQLARDPDNSDDPRRRQFLERYAQTLLRRLREAATMSSKHCPDCGSELVPYEHEPGCDGIPCHCPACGGDWLIFWDDEHNRVSGFQCDNVSADREIHDHGVRGGSWA